MPPKKDTLDADFSAILAKNPIEGNTDTILPQQFPGLAEALNISLSNDVALYALAWKCGCKEPVQISRSEWCNGLRAMRCTSVAQAAQAMGSLRAEIVPDENFRSFYDFVFEWTRDNSKARFIAAEGAIEMWPLLFQNRTFPHLKAFVEFVQAKGVKTIPKDCWKQMYHFAKADLNNWDENASWPSLFDDFVVASKKK